MEQHYPISLLSSALGISGLECCWVVWSHYTAQCTRHLPLSYVAKQVPGYSHPTEFSLWSCQNYLGMTWQLWIKAVHLFCASFLEVFVPRLDRAWSTLTWQKVFSDTAVSVKSPKSPQLTRTGPTQVVNTKKTLLRQKQTCLWMTSQHNLYLHTHLTISMA